VSRATYLCQEPYSRNIATMFEFTIRTPRKHRQFLVEAALGLTKIDAEWRVVDDAPQLLVQRVEDSLVIQDIGAGVKSGTLTLPARWRWGDAEFEARPAHSSGRSLSGLTPLETHCGELLRTGKFRGPNAQTVVTWYEALATLQQWTTSDPEFTPHVAELLIDPVGLDGAFVLSFSSDENPSPQWQIVASAFRDERGSLCFQRELVERLETEPVTWMQPMQTGRRAADREAMVIAPLRDAAGEVCGALYGVRVTHGGNGRRGVRYLEAHQVQALADQVSHLTIRHAQQLAAARQQALLEQAFTSELARELQRQPELLAPREREVTVLMADLRGFTGICAALPAPATYEFLAEVMEALTDVVLQEGGTIIDYYGDGLSAMWNAPCDQANHAERACRAALAMQERIAAIDEQWRTTLGAPLRMGVGVHTGRAQVGNAGSRRKLKYGPRGLTVNIASRIEQATKRLGVPVVVSRATQKRLGDGFTSTRLCRAKLRGAPTRVALYSISAGATGVPPVQSGANVIAHYTGDTPVAHELSVVISETFGRSIAVGGAIR
jgi:adenylate cyclase